ncbi:MAG: 4Fe-4S binding protein, partial [Desulfovibrio sp.]|nr:4Fe-4S binding protein [Desulfovibrio sp.]
MAETPLHLLSFSPCGGTAEVNRALARDVDAALVEQACTRAGVESEPFIYGPDDWVFLAFPVYGGRMPRNLDKVFARVEGNGARCALVAVYGNREYEGALLDLFAAASTKGFRPAAAVAAVAQHSLAPVVAAGRPDAKDRELLAGFGARIVAAMREGAVLAKAPGAYPEWKLPKGASLFPVTDGENCVGCGQCAALCPAGAISAADLTATDTSACIVCAACAKYCPTGARQMGTPESREKLAHHLLTAAARRKEPELWLGGAPGKADSGEP